MNTLTQPQPKPIGSLIVCSACRAERERWPPEARFPEASHNGDVSEIKSKDRIPTPVPLPLPAVLLMAINHSSLDLATTLGFHRRVRFDSVLAADYGSRMSISLVIQVGVCWGLILLAVKSKVSDQLVKNHEHKIAKELDVKGNGIRKTVASTTYMGMNALHAAGSGGRLPIYRYLVEVVKMDVDTPDTAREFTPVSHAIMYGHLPAVRLSNSFLNSSFLNNLF
ncbi:Ankyrin-3 [Hordeum vulgare]|nr:Ankyrin-3 [Hordeum vulgare]